MIIIFEACAGPSSATVGIGVGVGVPRPYPGPPSTTIWIGRPTPRTLYNNVPLDRILSYEQYNTNGSETHGGNMLVNEPE